MTNNKKSLKPPRGMRDFYPEDMKLRNAIFDAWRTSTRQFGFSEYDSCIVESLDLFKRKSGEEITEQIYHFQDKSGRELALRPEMTPTLARMIAARQESMTFPLKWATTAQCFRYERTTKGRKREHYQWNMDIIGEESAAAEAELIAAAVNALEILGLGPDKVKVAYSSRALLSEILSSAGIASEHHNAAFLALDKRDKIDDAAIGQLLIEAGIDKSTADKIFSMLEISSIDEAYDRINKDSPAAENLTSFNDHLKSYGITDMVTFDISIVRGLTYYTGLVFEAKDIEGRFRAIFGGGRYANLLEDIGGKPATGVGLGFGDVVIAEILAEESDKQSITDCEATAVGFMTTAEQSSAIRLASQLRRQGRVIDLALKAEKPKHFFSRTGKGAFSHAVYIGPDDVISGKARIKDLSTREETEVSLPG